MKKHNKKIVIIVVAIGLIIFSIIYDWKKPSIDPETFVEMAEANGFVIDKAEDSSDAIFDDYEAVNEEGNYKIVYWDIISDYVAEICFDTEVEKFEEMRNGGSKRNLFYGNYERYSATDDTTFYYVTRIGKTLISVSADIDKAEEINAFLDQIGYK